MGKRVKEKKHYHKNFNSFRQNDLDTAHVSFFFRGFFETYFTPLVFRELCESSTEYNMDMKIHFRMLPVGWQVKVTLFLFGFYNNLY